MNNEFHILNGDSLKEQFPTSIFGEIIVARLCLVDGNVKAKNLEELFKIRANFIKDNYDGYTEEDYYKKSVTEIEKIQNLSKNAIINLWFEDDLFCQVNFWFIINLISKTYKSQSIFLIRPKINSEYSFGSMNEEALVLAFQNKIKIKSSDITELSKLWKLYQLNDCDEMVRIAQKLNDRFPFLIPAIKAHKDRLPRNGNFGRPTQTLIQIMTELDTTEFGSVFKEFCKRDEIYGFGDLQVKRLFDKIIKANANNKLN